MNKSERKAARKAEERKDSIKAFKLLGAWVSSVVFLIVFLSVQAQAADLEITYYAKSEHFSNLHFNQNHNFAGLEIRNNDRGLGLSTFKNSYRHTSKMLSYSEYWQSNMYALEYSLSVGLATGYERYNKYRDQCPLVQGAKYCPIFSVGVTYTEYKYFRPKLSVFGGALVLSVSARF